MERAVVVEAESFVLCEVKTGYVCKSVLYTGKELTRYLDETRVGYRYLATKVVLELMSELLGLGYRLFIDNWYTSFEITSLLLQNNTDCIETLRKDRKGLLQDVSGKNTN